MPNVRGFSDEERAARVAALKQQYAAEDATNRRSNLSELGSDMWENAKGIGSIGANLATGLVSTPLAGLEGMGDTLVNNGDMDKAADATRRFQEQYTYPVNQRGSEQIGSVVSALRGAGGKAKEFAGKYMPHTTLAAHEAADVAVPAWDKFSTSQPALAAGVIGTLGVLDPTKGKGRGLARQTEEALLEQMAVPRSVETLGTAKAKREKAATKVVEKQNIAADAPQPQGLLDPNAPKEKGKRRAKVDADVYRKMYEEQGGAAVLDAAQRGEHLKPTPGGGYVGAPRTVVTEKDLYKQRRSVDKQLADAAEALKFADPERMGTWYPRAKESQAASNEPHQLPRSLEHSAVYSAGVAPESEIGFALRHHNSDILGTNEVAYRGPGAETLRGAVKEDRPADLGFKIGEYANKNDPRIVEEGPFGVNDFRYAQTWGYTDPKGAPWKGGVSETMHPFMDAETALLVDRANKSKLAGKEDYTGAVAQELPWVLGKADDIYARGTEGRFSAETHGSETAAKVAALREANNTIGDYFPKHTLSMTGESVPSAAGGHRLDVLDMPWEEKVKYGEHGRWDLEGPTIDSEFGEVGAGKRDTLLSAAGFRQLPARESIGNFEGKLGIENQPMTIRRPLVDFTNVGKFDQAGRDAAEAATAAGASKEEAALAGKQATIEALRAAGLDKKPPANQINAPTASALKAIEMLRGGVDAQAAVAANLPVTMASRTGKDNVLIELPGGAPSTPEQMQAVITALKAKGAGPDILKNVTATDRGVQVMTGFADNPKAARKLVEGVELPDANIEKAANEGFYEPVFREASEAGQGVTTTRILNAMAEAPEELARNVSESEAVRGRIRTKTARDEPHPQTAQDLQKMRKFFSDEDWNAVVQYMRKTKKPVAAAMAALGFSLEGMAAEQEQ